MKQRVKRNGSQSICLQLNIQINLLSFNIFRRQVYQLSWTHTGQQHSRSTAQFATQSEMDFASGIG